MKTNGSFNQTSKFDNIADALKFINESKCPADGFELAGMSIYSDTFYDHKTKKYDYTKKQYQCSISWKTPYSKEEHDEIYGTSSQAQKQLDCNPMLE